MKKSITIRTHIDYWWIVSIIVTAFFVVLVGGCTDTYDYLNYKKLFEGIYYSINIESGYTFIMEFCNTHGISYDLFRLLNIAICYFLISRIAYKHIGKKVIMMWFLYLFSAMAFDAVNLRSLVVTTIFIYAFIYALRGDNKGIFVFIALIIASMLFHKSALFFLICLPAFIKVNTEKDTEFKKRDIYIFIAVLFFVILASTPGLLSAMGQLFWKIISLATRLASNKSSYFEVKGHWGFLLFSACHASYLITIAYLRNMIKIHEDGCNRLTKSGIEKRKHFIEILYLCNILIILFLPIIRMNAEMYRVIRSFQLLEYIGFYYGLDIIPHYSIYRMVLGIMIVVSAAINFFILVFPYYDEIFITMFNSNLYF